MSALEHMPGPRTRQRNIRRRARPVSQARRSNGASADKILRMQACWRARPLAQIMRINVTPRAFHPVRVYSAASADAIPRAPWRRNGLSLARSHPVQNPAILPRRELPHTQSGCIVPPCSTRPTPSQIALIADYRSQSHVHPECARASPANSTCDPGAALHLHPHPAHDPIPCPGRAPTLTQITTCRKTCAVFA